jgi:hypothetical protein
MLASLVLGIACGETGSAPNSLGQWTRISERTTCEIVVAANCSGLYGFSINQSGAFVAGPSPTGTTVQGNISTDELNILSAAATAYLTSAASQTGCQSTSGVPGTSDLIVLSTTAISQVQVFASNAQQPGVVCISADATKAKALSDSAQQLRSKYYPNPFPSQ